MQSYLLIFVILINLRLAYTKKGLTGDPEFAEPMKNFTVPAGRDVSIPCSVKNLGSHKVMKIEFRSAHFVAFGVAFIHFEGSAILTVQNHVITRNPRIRVSHDKHHTWYLHIDDVQQTDAGSYLCQINSETAKTQTGYIRVVVPPSIDDSLSSSDVIVHEGADVSLRCKGIGSPKPKIKWTRYDKREMRINKTLSVREWEGDALHLNKISRLDMGDYMCIASNGVPPAVSKLIKVSVDFTPMLWIPHQLYAAKEGDTAVLECTSEAHPASLNYWTREDGHMIHVNKKYDVANIIGTPSYKTQMKLTIKHIGLQDEGLYKCMAKNPRGETDGTIKINVIPRPTRPTVATTTPRYRRRNTDNYRDRFDREKEQVVKLSKETNQGAAKEYTNMKGKNDEPSDFSVSNNWSTGNRNNTARFKRAASIYRCSLILQIVLIFLGHIAFSPYSRDIK